MKHKHVWVVLFAMLALSMLLGACAPTPPPVSATKKLTENFKVAYLEAQKVYQQRLTLDIEKTRLVRSYVNKMDELRGSVADELAIMGQCYTNTEEFFAAAVSGVFGQDGIGNSLTAEAETTSLINALSLNQLYPGDVAICQAQGASVVIKMRATRSEAINLKNEVFRVDAAITDLERSDVGTAVVIQFYNEYGGDLQSLIRNSDAEFKEFIGAQPGEPLPADFFGFPTAGLEAETRNVKVCTGYKAIYDGEVDPPTGRYKYQYAVSLDPVSGICTLRQAAAEGYIKMILSPSLELSNDLETGCTSALGCDDK